MAIEDLTSQLTMLKERGAPDLQLSEATRDAYIGLIKQYRSALKEQRDNAELSQGILHPGDYGSANEIRRRLTNYVAGIDGIVGTLDKLLRYLDELEAMVNAAFKRMQAADKS